MFKLPTLTGWNVIVSGLSLEEALRISESKLSFRQLANEVRASIQSLRSLPHS